MPDITPASDQINASSNQSKDNGLQKTIQNFQDLLKNNLPGTNPSGQEIFAPNGALNLGQNIYPDSSIEQFVAGHNNVGYGGTTSNIGNGDNVTETISNSTSSTVHHSDGRPDDTYSQGTVFSGTLDGGGHHQYASGTLTSTEADHWHTTNDNGVVHHRYSDTNVFTGTFSNKQFGDDGFTRASGTDTDVSSSHLAAPAANGKDDVTDTVSSSTTSGVLTQRRDDGTERTRFNGTSSSTDTTTVQHSNGLPNDTFTSTDSFSGHVNSFTGPDGSSVSMNGTTTSTEADHYHTSGDNGVVHHRYNDTSSFTGTYQNSQFGDDGHTYISGVSNDLSSTHLAVPAANGKDDVTDTVSSSQVSGVTTQIRDGEFTRTNFDGSTYSSNGSTVEHSDGRPNDTYSNTSSFDGTVHSVSGEFGSVTTISGVSSSTEADHWHTTDANGLVHNRSNDSSYSSGTMTTGQVGDVSFTSMSGVTSDVSSTHLQSSSADGSAIIHDTSNSSDMSGTLTQISTGDDQVRIAQGTSDTTSGTSASYTDAAGSHSDTTTDTTQMSGTTVTAQDGSNSATYESGTLSNVSATHSAVTDSSGNVSVNDTNNSSNFSGVQTTSAENGITSNYSSGTTTSLDTTSSSGHDANGATSDATSQSSLTSGTMSEVSSGGVDTSKNGSTSTSDNSTHTSSYYDSSGNYHYINEQNNGSSSETANINNSSGTDVTSNSSSGEHVEVVLDANGNPVSYTNSDTQTTGSHSVSYASDGTTTTTDSNNSTTVTTNGTGADTSNLSANDSSYVNSTLSAAEAAWQAAHPQPATGGSA